MTKPATTRHHPLIERAIEIATADGSRATTVRGLVRYAIDHRPPVYPLPLDGGGLAVLRAVARLDWQECVARRKGDPERSRCRDDPAYRRGVLRRLRTQYRAECVAAAGVNDIPAWERCAAAAARIADRIVLLGGVRPADLPPCRIMLVPIDMDTALSLRVPLDRRGNDHAVSATSSAIYECDHTPPHYIWRDTGKEVDDRYLPAVARDGRARYVRASRDHYVPSSARIVGDTTIAYRVADRASSRVIVLESPVGTTWAADADGLMLRTVAGDDYHVTARDLLALEAGDSDWLGAAIERRHAADSAIAERVGAYSDLQAVWVSVADSLAAGNCEAGTLREAAILWRRVLRGVGEPGAIRADVLLAYRDDRYTRRAVLAAQRA
jgi:hypothetical protein